MMLAQWEGVITAHAYFRITHYIYDKVKRLGVMYQCVYPEFADVVAWICFIVNGAEVGAHIEAMLYTANGKWETAAAMREGYP